MDNQKFKELTDNLPETIGKPQSNLGEILGRNAYSISGYSTGRIENIPVEIANLVICLDFLNRLQLLPDVIPLLERKESLVK